MWHLFYYGYVEQTSNTSVFYMDWLERKHLFEPYLLDESTEKYVITIACVSSLRTQIYLTHNQNLFVWRLIQPELIPLGIFLKLFLFKGIE
jgi:hypothetical protein